MFNNQLIAYTNNRVEIAWSGIGILDGSIDICRFQT